MSEKFIEETLEDEIPAEIREKENLAEEKEKKEHQPLQGPAKYAVMGLGIFVMLAGIGFVLMQMVGGGGSSNQQQMMTMPQNSAQSQGQTQTDQTSEKLQALLAQAEESGKDTVVQDQAPENNPAAEPKFKSEPGTDHGPANLKKKSLNEPSEQAAMPQLQQDQMNAASTTTSTDARSNSNTTDARLTEVHMDKLMEKLAAIKDSVDDRLQVMTSSIKEVRQGVSTNGDRVEALAGKVKQASGGSSVDLDKFGQLVLEKKSLTEEMAELKKEVNVLEGKYKWVRHLESERSQELRATQRKLEKAEEELTVLSRRPVFGEWQLAGLSNEEMLLVNPYSGDVKRLNVGDSFLGVAVEEINAQDGVVRTNAGTLKLG